MLIYNTTTNAVEVNAGTANTPDWITTKTVSVNTTATSTTQVETNYGNLNFNDAGTGVILKSPLGVKYLITVKEDGTLNSQKVN